MNEFVSSAEEHPRVREMYARTFHVPEDRVIQYMRTNLVPSYMPVDRTFTVYCVRRDGTIYSIKQKLRRGTKVFALRSGVPLLKWVCGNPLSSKLPSVESYEAPSIQTLTPADTQDVFVPVEVDQPTTQDVASDLQGYVPPPGPPSTPTYDNPGSTTQVDDGGGGGGGGWWFAGIPALAVFGHSGGSHVPLAPEPSGATTSLIMVLGLGSWIASRQAIRPRAPKINSFPQGVARE